MTEQRDTPAQGAPTSDEISALIEQLREAAESLHLPPSIQSQRNIRIMNACDRAAAELKRLHDIHAQGMTSYNARDHFLRMTDQSNWPEMVGDEFSGYKEAMDAVHEGVMDFWPELQATVLPDAPAEGASSSLRDEALKAAEYLEGIASDAAHWQLALTHANALRRALALSPSPAVNADRCAKCGEPRKEHAYNGACYGICGEFVSPSPAESTD